VFITEHDLGHNVDNRTTHRKSFLEVDRRFVMGQASLSGDTLPSKLASAFQAYCTEYPVDKIGELREEINSHIQKLELALSRNEFLDIKTARRIAGVLEFLLTEYTHYSSEHRSLVTGAAKYFIHDLDVEPDTKSILGLDDDVRVLNFVLEQVGKPDLRVEL